MTESYFSHPRPEVRALVPPTARRVVDVGCGAGAMGAALKAERPGLEVRGVEANPEAAARAAGVLDGVSVAPGDAEMPGSWPAPDCVVLADVLEHMVDPWQALRRWRACLKHGGCIVVSLPNVAHASVVRELRRGRWDYVDEGLLDRTHLRFFTRATAVELVEAEGFEVEVMRRAVPRPSTLGEWLCWPLVLCGLEWESRRHRVPRWLLRALDSRSRQILLRAVPSAAARKAPPSPHG